MKIISIDCGVKHLGFCIFQFDLDDNYMSIIDIRLIDLIGTKLIKHDKQNVMIRLAT